MCYGYHIWSKEALMQAENDDDLDGGQRSSEVKWGKLTLTLLYITKPHKNYLQNTQHVVLRNRPTLSIGTERLACLNNPCGVQLGTLA